jgi:hypothetical protein
VALEQPTHVAVALLASAEAYTPTAQRLIDGVRERVGSLHEAAAALADNLPAPKQPSSKSRRRRRKKKRKADQTEAQGKGRSPNGKPKKGDAEKPRTPEPAATKST